MQFLRNYTVFYSRKELPTYEKDVTNMKNTAETYRRKKHGNLWLIVFILLFAVVSLVAVKLITASAPPLSGLIGNGGGGDLDINSLEALAEKDSRVDAVIQNIDDYPETFIQLLLTNPDARDYVLDYPKRKNDVSVGSITAEELSYGIPRLYQWDGRWGYTDYGSDKLGITGCGPTCLSMVITGLTGNSSYTPAVVAKYSEDNGHYVSGSGTSWSLMTEGISHFGIKTQEVPLWEESMVAELESGRPIIVNVGPGDFTTEGHFIVITGYENGMFIVNDPNSPTRSSEGWYYSTLEGQISNMWSCSLDF